MPRREVRDAFPVFALPVVRCDDRKTDVEFMVGHLPACFTVLCRHLIDSVEAAARLAIGSVSGVFACLQSVISQTLAELTRSEQHAHRGSSMKVHLTNKACKQLR